LVRSPLGIAVVTLVLVALAIQSVAAVGFLGYCDENLDPGTARETVCHVADGGGYVVGLVLPPAGILVAGLVAIRRRRMSVVLWAFAVAVTVGITVPLATALIAGYR
jgi:hypothetical protein